jgi:predicted dehydrogenase
MDRRDFLKTGAAVATMLQTKNVMGANDRVRVAIVGLRGRGKDHIKRASEIPGVEIAALCDIDDSVIAQRLQDLDKQGLPKPKTYTDYRKLLEDKSIDAVSIATPNHWHSLMGIWAVQAGKDAYIEKPCSHNFWEGKQLVAAVAKYDRIVQHGSQSRSSIGIREAMGHINSGLIGDVYLSRGLCFKWRDTIGHQAKAPIPSGVNYDLWLGPAPDRGFTKNRFHYTWHWFWDTGNGDLGNQGIHEVDIARWGLGVKYPTKVTAMGGKYMFDDDQETPNTINALLEFDVNGKKKLMAFDVRHWMSNHEAGIGEEKRTGARPATREPDTIGNTFFGSKGYLAIDGYTKYQTWMGAKHEPGPAASKGGDHFLNFIEAVRSRKRSDLNAEIEEGAASTICMHLANIAYRVGRTLHFDEKTMTVVNDHEANKLFTRDYRKPFVVPKLGGTSPNAIG